MRELKIVPERVEARKFPAWLDHPLGLLARFRSRADIRINVWLRGIAPRSRGPSRRD